MMVIRAVQTRAMPAPMVPAEATAPPVSCDPRPIVADVPTGAVPSKLVPAPVISVPVVVVHVILGLFNRTECRAGCANAVCCTIRNREGGSPKCASEDQKSSGDPTEDLPKHDVPPLDLTERISNSALRIMVVETTMKRPKFRLTYARNAAGRDWSCRRSRSPDGLCGRRRSDQGQPWS